MKRKSYTKFVAVKASVEKTLDTKLTAKEFGVTPTRINQVLREGGTSMLEIRKNHLYTLREKYEELAEKFGRVPTLPELKRLSPRCDKKSFHDFAKAFQKEMLQKGKEKWRPPSASKEALIQSLQELAKKTKSTPSNTTIGKTGFSHMTFVRMFGSIRNAQLEAGLLPNPRGKQKRL
jgi:hypothetical protein